MEPVASEPATPRVRRKKARTSPAAGPDSSTASSASSAGTRGGRKPRYYKGRKRGRPLALTKAKAKRIIDALKGGAPLRTAAAIGGISEDALAGYRDPKSPTYVPDFAEAVARARDLGAGEHLKTIVTAAKADWRAARFLLSVLQPDVYGNRVIMGGIGGGPVPLSIEGDLRVAGDIRSTVDASKKLHDVILAAAGTARK